MAPKKVSTKVPDTTDKTSDSSEDGTSDSSSSYGESDTDLTDSDDEEHIQEEENGKIANTRTAQTTEHKQLQCKGKKSPEFRLSCLCNWDSQSTGLRKHLAERKEAGAKSVSAVGIGGPLSSDFTPWWEGFTNSKHHKSGAKLKSSLKKDEDTYESWFSKTPTEGTSWLCGSGSSAQPATGQKSKVEDIEVPSIYDKKPQLKSRRALKKERKAERDKTLGKKWFGMKAPDVDEKLKNDMELIQMRGILDPKRFYKHQDRKALPKYFQMGTVVDEGTDFYSSRLTKKQRKQTLVEELMADANIRQYNKRKYAELQQKMRSKKKFKSKKK